MASVKLIEWMRNVDLLLASPPVEGPCQIIIESYSNKMLLTTVDYDGDASYAQEGEEGVIAVLSFPASFYVNMDKDG